MNWDFSHNQWDFAWFGQNDPILYGRPRTEGAGITVGTGN